MASTGKFLNCIGIALHLGECAWPAYHGASSAARRAVVLPGRSSISKTLSVSSEQVIEAVSCMFPMMVNVGTNFIPQFSDTISDAGTQNPKEAEPGAGGGFENRLRWRLEGRSWGK